VDPSDAVRVAETFISGNKEMLGVDGRNTFVHEHTNVTADSSKLMRFTQFFNGIPILGSGYTIGVVGENNILRDEGDVYYVFGKMRPNIEVDTTPLLSITDATLTIVSLFGESLVRISREPLLAIFLASGDSSGKGELVYSSIVELDDDAKTVYISAQDGSLVYSTGQYASHGGSPSFARFKNFSAEIETAPYLEFARGIKSKPTNKISSKSVACTSPCGMVHATDPDQSDSTLQHLYYLNGNTELDGTFFTMRKAATNDDGDIPQDDANGDFVFLPTAWEFDAVNAYYHASNALLKLLESPEEKILIETSDNTTHAFPDEINPEDGTLSLGVSNGNTNSASLAPAVTVHEYWHMITMFRNSDLNNGLEQESLWEGVSDFAGVLYGEIQGSTSTKIGEYFDKAGGCDWPREVKNNMTSYEQYPDGDYDFDGCTPTSGDPHDLGMVIGGALWDWYHLNSGSSLMKLGVFRQAIMALPSSPVSADMIGAMIGTVQCEWLDNNSHDCSGDIETKFCNHGLEDTEYFTCMGTPKRVAADEDAIASLESSTVPTRTALVGNYPNPFNPSTSIQYDLKEDSFVEVQVFDLLGRLVKTLVSQPHLAGRHSVIWDGINSAGSAVPSGTYVYRLKAGDFVQSNTLVLVK
jgi:FlgD Ig-like domain